MCKWIPVSGRKREENEQLFGVDRQLLREFDVLAVSVAPWSDRDFGLAAFGRRTAGMRLYGATLAGVKN